MMKLLLVLAVAAPAVQSQNAIKKIVGLLEGMKATVTKEGQEATSAWEQYSENFRSQKQGTEYNIKDATDDLEAAKACMADSAAKAQEEEANIASLGNKIAEDQAALAQAIKIREEENADFQKSEADLTDTVDMLVRAASIIRKATGGAGSAGTAARLKTALTQVAGSLQVVLNAAYINADSKKQLQALLQQPKEEDDDAAEETAGYVQPTAAAYTAKSGSIVDLLADLKQQAEGELSDLRGEEMKKQQAFEMTKQSLTDAIATAERDLGNAKTRLATENQTNAECTAEAEAQDKKLKENENLLAEITQINEQKTAEYEQATKDRAGELEALSKAIEILTAEDFSEATARRDVFLQTSQAPDVRSEIADILRKAGNRFSNVGLTQLAESAMEDPFGKVKGLIKEMVDRLQKQAAEEADHKAYCDKENKKATAKRDDLSSKLETYQARHEKAQADAAQIKEDLANIAEEQARMDSEQAAAKKLRDEQSAAYASLMEDCRVGLDGIARAIQVLKEYYSQQHSHGQKDDSATNVVAFLEVAQSDMIKMKTDGEEEERTAADQFEKLSNEYEVMSASNAATVKAKEAEAARLASAISDLSNDVDGTSTELNATLEYLEKLKEACVHKVMSFEERAAKMQQEIESLQQALEILENETAGGESFLQRK